MKQQCCDKCRDVYFEKDYPMHTAINYCTNSSCECHKVLIDTPTEPVIEDWEKEEWNGWKIISDMLDDKDEYGIYNTSNAYRKLYNFVMEQKQKARLSLLQEIEKELESKKENVKLLGSFTYYKGDVYDEEYYYAYREALQVGVDVVRSKMK